MGVVTLGLSADLIHSMAIDLTVGREIRNMRPALILQNLQNHFGNRFSPLTIVAAGTSRISPTLCFPST
jgi:mRNA-degrading endonuclease toxin of MazEF toxin-antitoxin module